MCYFSFVEPMFNLENENISNKLKMNAKSFQKLKAES